MSRAFSRLAQVSTQALNYGQPRWDRDSVRGYLRAALLDADDSHGSYASVLSATFGVVRGADGSLSNRVSEQSSSDSILRLRGYFCEVSAPECCALLSALNLDFETAAQGFIEQPPNTTSAHRETKILLKTLTVSEARKEITDRVKRRSNYPAAHRLLYWFLRVHDSEWLQQNFPGAAAVPMPSISDDRSTIIDELESSSLFKKNRQLKSKLALAILRSKIRDQNWYLEQRVRLLQSRRERSKARSNHLFRSRLASVEEAIQKSLREEGRPERIFTTTLAQMAGISYQQMQKLIQVHPQIRICIAEVNADKNRRRLIWAARGLQAEGYPLSVTKICQRARVRLTKDTNMLIQNVIADLTG